MLRTTKLMPLLRIGSLLRLKRKPGLQLETPIIRAFREYSGTGSGGLIRLAKHSSGDVANNRTGVVVIGQIENLR
jgi:hypothetical protein